MRLAGIWLAVAVLSAHGSAARRRAQKHGRITRTGYARPALSLRQNLVARVDTSMPILCDPGDFWAGRHCSGDRHDRGRYYDDCHQFANGRGWRHCRPHAHCPAGHLCAEYWGVRPGRRPRIVCADGDDPRPTELQIRENHAFYPELEELEQEHDWQLRPEQVQPEPEPEPVPEAEAGNGDAGSDDAGDYDEDDDYADVSVGPISEVIDAEMPTDDQEAQSADQAGPSGSKVHFSQELHVHKPFDHALVTAQLEGRPKVTEAEPSAKRFRLWLEPPGGELSIYRNDETKPLCTTAQDPPALCEPQRVEPIAPRDRLRIEFAIDAAVQLAYDLIVSVRVADAGSARHFDPKGKRPKDPSP